MGAVELGLLSSQKRAIGEKLAKPETAGTSGQVLVSDGEGGQVWGDIEAGEVVIDSTLSVSGAAADAKKAGDEISDLKNAIQQKADIIKNSVSGDPAVIVDGEANVPFSSLVVEISSDAGFTGCTLNVKGDGKNLFNKDAVPFKENGYISNVSGNQFVYSDSNNFNVYKIAIEPSTKYTFGLIKSGSSPLWATVSKSGNISRYEFVNGGSDGKSITFTSFSNDEWLFLSVAKAGVSKCDDILQLEKGDSHTSYEAYNGKEYSVSWNTEAGTIKEGTIDLISGEIETTLPSEGTYQIDPVSVKTLSIPGANRIWANTGRIIEASFPVDTKEYIEKAVGFFGICGDGVTDDTDALQALVNSTGTVCLVPNQTIKITSTINVDPSKTKIINGNGAKIIVDGDFCAFNIEGTLTGTANPNSTSAEIIGNEAGTIIKDIRITSSDGESGCGIQATKTFKLNITGCYIFKMKNGIRIYGNNRDMRICGNSIYAMINNGILFDEVNLHQCNIENNMIQYCLTCLHIDDPSAIANFQIIGNDIEIGTYPSPYTDSRTIIFENANIEGQFGEIEICGNTIQGHTGDYLIDMIGNSTVPIANMNITGNHISNSNGRGMYFENVLNVAITGNTYASITDYVYELAGSCENVVIVGDTATSIWTGRIHSPSTAVLKNITCKYCFCTPNGSDSIETSDVTNVDLN